MEIRIGFAVIILALIIALVICALKCFKSGKKVNRAVGTMELSFLPPMIGNLILIVSTVKELSLVGCYVYYVGMDMIIAAMVYFTFVYCKGISKREYKPTLFYVLMGLDAIQVMLNPLTGHVFSIEGVEVYGYIYYRAVPGIGLMIHRGADYFIFFCVVLIYIIAIIKTAKIYRERYSVMLLAMLFVALWQTFYIFSRAPIDRSMIGYGVMGLLIHYLSLYYRPLRLLDRMLSNIVSDMKESLFVYDQFGKCIWANENGLKLTGVKKNEYEEVSPVLRKMFGERPFTHDDWSYKRIIGSGEDASYYTLENYFVSEDSKHLAGFYLIVRDDTEEQKKIKRDLYNSTHDSLTGLYTKQYLFTSIAEVLEADPEKKYSVVFVDVKNFKIVNDIFGTQFGDLALQQISHWLKDNLTDKGLYGRLAGDTFGIFAPAELIENDKEKIEKALINFVVTDGNIEHRLLIQLGAYEIDDRSIDVSVMFDRAHLALSTITGNYKKHFVYYDKKLREKILWDQRITANLGEAIDTMQIRPYLQPITDRSGKVVGAEALARWIHPEQGFMSPAMFIPILEKNGLIVEVDRHIWRCACKILSEWKKENKDLFISVNISPKDFYYIDIKSEIMGLVKEYGIDNKKLRIEITETVMMNDAEEKFAILQQLRDEGFIVEMDDFGSGFSSLNLLKDMPVDVLKIDMKFLSRSDNDEKAQTIIKNIIKLSEDLNITSLTEGVETLQQYSDLSDMGCKLFQGFYFAKPLPRDEFDTFAEKQNSGKGVDVGTV